MTPKAHPRDALNAGRPSGRRAGALEAVALGVLWAGLLAASVPLAAKEPPLSPDEARKKLEMRKNELDAAKDRAKFLQSDVTDLTQEREKLNAKLIETSGLIISTEGRLSEIEGRLAGLESDEKALRADLERNGDKIGKLLAALQRMGRNPPPVLYTQRSDALQMVRSAMLLASAFPELRKDALALATKLTQLITIADGIRTDRDNLRRENASLADARTRLSALMETKKQTLSQRQAELAQVRAAAAEYTKNITELNDLIGKADQTAAASTGLGAYEAEVKARQGTQQPAADPSAPAKPAEPPPPKARIVELAPAMTLGASTGRLKPAIDFADARGRLPAPAFGNRVLAFNDRTQLGGQSRGIVIETRANAQVIAPCDGWVIYAGEFRSYGQLLIINAGGGYHILLAGLSQIDVQPGQFILAAEPVGTMGGAGPAAAGKPSNPPVLYVEFRKDNRPIDPDPWWAAPQKKVQG